MRGGASSRAVFGAVLLACLPWRASSAFGAPGTAADTSVMLLPIEPKGAVTRDQCDLLSAALATEASRIPGHRVVTVKELEGAITQEQVRQIAGCVSEGCAAEIAGALNVDEIVIGNLGVFGREYVFTLSRIQASNAKVLGRSLRRYEVSEEAAILDGLPSMIAELFGRSPARAAPEPRRAPIRVEPPAVSRPRETDAVVRTRTVRPGWAIPTLVAGIGACVAAPPLYLVGLAWGTAFGLVAVALVQGGDAAATALYPVPLCLALPGSCVAMCAVYCLCPAGLLSTGTGLVGTLFVRRTEAVDE